MAVWSPDGSRIAFSSQRDGNSNLYLKVSSGAGAEDVLLKSSGQKSPYDWSPDGRFLLYGQLAGATGFDLLVLPLTGDDRRPRPYLATESQESQARFSPDGRFVAYTSDETGKSEVYVRPFPDASSGMWQISTAGGNQPRWRRDGKELFYISADSKIMAVNVRTAPVFQQGDSKALFPTAIWGGAATVNVTRYDDSPDGQKFLINSVPADTSAPVVTPITVVLNWMTGLKR